MREHLDRYEFTNENYKALGTPGWRSDRGRIYILFGRPSNIESHPADPGYKPWEIWQYESIEGLNQVEFIFGDLTEFNNYELLHSNYQGNVLGEKIYIDWERLLIK